MDTLHNPTSKGVPRILIGQDGQLTGTAGSANPVTGYQQHVEATLHELHDYEPVDNIADLDAAVAAGRAIEVRELIPIAANRTISTRVKVHDGAGFDISAGVVLTMDGELIGVSQRQHIFRGTGNGGSTSPGQVVGKFGDADRSVNWFGAQPVAGFDSVDAINSALKAFSSTGSNPVTVVVPAEVYYIGSEIDMSDVSNFGTELKGYGRASSTIRPLAAFAGQVFDSSEYVGGTRTLIHIGTTAAQAAGFGITISGIRLDAWTYSAARLSCVYQPFFTQEFCNIEGCVIGGYTGFGIGIGAADEEAPANRPDINGFHINNCEIVDAAVHAFPDGSAKPINVMGGRNFVLTRSTVFGYSDPSARTDPTKWLPASVTIRNSNFVIESLHTEGGEVVFDLYEKKRAATAAISQSGGNISSIESVRFGRLVRINDQSLSVTLSQLRGTYNAAQGATAPPYPAAPTSPMFVDDIPAGKNSAGYAVVNGTDRALGFYSRTYQNSVGHPFPADPNYATGTRVVTNHLELQ
jgi:hypothetical protein